MLSCGLGHAELLDVNLFLWCYTEQGGVGGWEGCSQLSMLRMYPESLVRRSAGPVFMIC